MPSGGVFFEYLRRSGALLLHDSHTYIHNTVSFLSYNFIGFCVVCCQFFSSSCGVICGLVYCWRCAEWGISLADLKKNQHKAQPVQVVCTRVKNNLWDMCVLQFVYVTSREALVLLLWRSSSRTLHFPFTFSSHIVLAVCRNLYQQSHRASR